MAPSLSFDPSAVTPTRGSPDRRVSEGTGEVTVSFFWASVIFSSRSVIAGPAKGIRVDKS